MRTVAVLTREIIAGAAPAYLSVRARRLEGEGGFCGFLVGAGGGKLDHRAAALVQKASGEGGGILCVWESDGRARFREHTDEQRPLAFAPLESEPLVSTRAASLGAAMPSGEVLLRLAIVPGAPSRFDLKMAAFDPADDSFIAGATLRNVAEADLLGGIALVSSPAGQSGVRYAFRDLQSGGGKVARRPERALGPVLGTLHSLNGSVLKLSAQFLPIGDGEAQTATLRFRPAGGRVKWHDGPTAKLAPGYTALFRVDGWDATRDWEYQVVYDGTPRYDGTVRKDPAAKETLSLGLFSCIIPVARNLDGGGPGAPELPNAERLGRYTHKNIYFPHRELTANAGRHRPDLLVFTGDQLYEGNPTRRDNSPDPTLDYLYKWYLWLWAFRDLTRDTPTIVLVDDHDVYHGNVWGDGGRAAPGGDIDRGGYRCSGSWVNLVQRTQCGHNPDPFDPTPVEQGITVYYGAFRFGGVSFAVLEDRKWKSPPPGAPEADAHEPRLLGERQERFLQAWAKDRRTPDEPKICLTQTVFACVHTDAQGRPSRDPDSNGYPRAGRDRAVRLLREANALVLSGDQHLATLVRHGIDTFDDGPVQFSGPAGGSQWQRWFEPATPLPNARPGVPDTGDFVDAWGNKVRMLACANPKVTHAYYAEHRQGRQGKNLGDRRLKSEGYGLVRVDKKRRTFVLDCWPHDADPTAPGARQFAGWPFTVAFAEAGSGKSDPRV